MSRKLLPLSITAALMGGTALADAPNVAVDIAPVHSLVARVMDGVGTPDLIVAPGASPHEYNLRPSEAAALQEADLVFWMGEDLTPWMENAIDTLADGATVTSMLEADGTVLLDFRENALFEAHDHGDEDGHDDHAEDKDHDDHDHGDDHDHEDHAKEDGHDHDEHDHDDHAKDDDHDHEEHADHDGHDDHDDHDHEDHAEEDGHDHDDHEEHDHDDHAKDDHDDHDDHGHEGHAHGDHDPHAWLSPANAETWLNVIAAQLSAADPENAGTYFANAAAARDEMAALSAEVAETLDPVRGGSFIVFHDAYQYFEDAFDFPASGAISIGDASDPSPARIAEIQGRIRDEGIDCVLAEPQFDPGIVESVMGGVEAKTSVIDPLGSNLEPGVDLYPNVIRSLAKSLAECL
ncbi:zinc ABC transporter substrate-binding protein [Ruegeria sp. HKCCD4332]|uniref:zinc ABC transporter substrate-binding protein n=1 Tax=Ruegeria sp. HKCCD4332 TaxID=2683021 RepID=UPI001492A081|nr:zinc ABC transporter substrate-binding protein [Ruegeria sp. HKCCD4332]NOD78235.1 zinc ABC transporter solute-binding protein [Ruegeria sp. HKCCD4332]